MSIDPTDPTDIPVQQVTPSMAIDLNLRRSGYKPPTTPRKASPMSTEINSEPQPIYDQLQTGAIPMTIPANVTEDVAAALADDERAEMSALHLWWQEEATEDAELCLAKLFEYGSSDFDIMAQSMIAVGGGAWSGATDSDKARIGREMAILFYLQGKVARAFGALQKGRVPSEDTYNDITRYSMILRRVRQTGKWGA